MAVVLWMISGVVMYSNLVADMDVPSVISQQNRVNIDSMSARKTFKPGVVGAVLAFVGMSAVASVLVAAAVTPAIAVTGLTANSTLGIFDNLPDYLAIGDLAEKTSIYATAADGSEVLLASFYAQDRQEVTWDQVSDFVKDAAIATEDPRFYEHGGIDLMGTVRAALSNSAGGDVQGGSSITQQYVKNVLVQKAEEISDPAERAAAFKAATETSIDRKLKEMKLAIGVEQDYSKQDILMGYLNIASFGGRVYGIESAAQHYYGVSAKDLTLAQSASLMATVNNPNNLRVDMPDNIEENQNRRDYVLNRMLSEEKISQKQHDEAVAEPVTPNIVEASTGCQTAGGSAFFCDYVTWTIKNDPAFGDTADERWTAFQRGGWKIMTTLNLDVQAASIAAIDANVPKVIDVGDLAATSVSLQVGTGRILSMAQSKDYSNDPEVIAAGGGNFTSVNYNTDSAFGGSTGFQVGSTYKLFVLSEWLKAGHGLNESVAGSVKTWNMSEFTNSCDGTGGPTWRPTNYSGGGQTATVQVALNNSWNTNFITMASKLDLCNIRKDAESLLVHRADGNQLTSNPSAVLGTNEIAPMTMATAVAGIANGGMTCHPIAIDKITDRNGKDIPPPTADCVQALPTNVANTVAFGMTKVPTATAQWSPTGDGVPYIAKTGTSEYSEHNWMLGSTTAVSTAVWFGNVSGHTPAIQFVQAPYIMVQHMWRDIMRVVNPIYGGGEFGAPDAALVSGKSISVPDVKGLNLAQAKSLIESVGFTFEDGGAVDSELPAGSGVNTEPAAGTTTAMGTPVKYFSSNQALVDGPPSTLGMTEAAARSALTGWAVTVMRAPAPSPTACSSPAPSSTPPPTPATVPSSCPVPNPDQGKVIAQDITGGFAKPGATVTITVQG
jgi:membrane peptidoglycan carboxypeptidase